MSEFATYLKVGFYHISDLNAYDHILFIVALTAVYQLKDIKKIALLVTSFTVGHSITLALATLNLVSISSAIIEFLIPVTIFITCIYNVSTHQQKNTSLKRNSYWVNYGMALFFGLIHGLGFSNYLRALLGNEESLFVPLLSFNIGLEIGQLLIVAVILVLMFVFQSGLKISNRSWAIFLSGAAAGISIILMKETAFWGV